MDSNIIISRFNSLIYLMLNHWRYIFMFGLINRKCRIHNPLKIDGGRRIFLKGKYIVVEKYTWLAAMPLTGVGECRLEIEEGVKIGCFNHIYCTNKIIIEKGVLTADKVYISDNLHSYEDVTTHIYQQPIKQLQPVIIGEGAWLGENVCVIGASIGKGSVIGANSVVTKNIPDYCVAVGAPAKVIKKYNKETNKWEKV